MNFESILKQLSVEELQDVHESFIKLYKSRFLQVMKEEQGKHLLTIAQQAGGNPEMERQLILESKNFTVLCNFIDGLHKLFENET